MQRIVGLVLFVIVVLPAMGLSAHAFYERVRERSTPELIEQLGDYDMQLAWEARDTLIKQGAAPLIQALRHSNADVRRNAAWALESLSDPAARDDLKRLLNDPDPLTREHAKKALNRLPPR
jgi:HEAT repeat protein